MQRLFTFAELCEVGMSAPSLDYLKSEGLAIPADLFTAKLDGRTFQHKWEIREVLAEISEAFRYREGDETWNNQVDERFNHFFSQLEE